jgi:diguanylate cyclase (GGDEF)-like protein
MPTILELETQLKGTADQQSRIDILSEIAWIVHLNDKEKGRNLAEQAYDLSANGDFEQQPYLAGLAGSLRCLAALNNDAGNYVLALSQSLRALEILKRIPSEKVEITLLKVNVLGVASWTYRSLGDYVAATEYAMKGIKLAQAIGDRIQEAGMLNILSVIYAESNNLTAALETGKKVLQYHREGGTARGKSLALNNLAMTYLELGMGEQALEACKESLHLARENGIETVALTAFCTLGEIYLGTKDFVRAEEFLLQALTLARENKAGSDELQCLLNLGKIYQYKQNDEAALSVLQSALSLSHTSNDRRGEFQSHQLLSEVYEKRQEFEAAFQHYKQFHALKETIFNEDTAKRLAGLQVVHQVETAKRETEIHYLKTIELKREIEERKSAQDSLRKLASIDPLTEALNRRELFILGEQELKHALQKEQPFTVILFDIDHFKQINDTYGHAIGDQVLIHTTKIVRESLRQGEIIGRYGGDEFVILLPGSNCTQGQEIAERLRNKMASQGIASGKNNLHVTISIGIAEFNQARDTALETLLACADQALYVAKQAGRNQLAIYSDSLS